MDYSQVKKHIDCKEYLHDLTMTLEIVKILAHDISKIQYNEDYRSRLHIDHDEVDYRISFYKKDEMDENAVLHNNFIMRNSYNNLCVGIDKCTYNMNQSSEFDFSDIREEIVELCNSLIENYNKDK